MHLTHYDIFLSDVAVKIIAVELSYVGCSKTDTWDFSHSLGNYFDRIADDEQAVKDIVAPLRAELLQVLLQLITNKVLAATLDIMLPTRDQ